MRRQSRQQLTAAENVTIATLAAKGLTVAEICETVERSPHLVRKALVQSKEMLGMLSPAAVSSWYQAMQVAGKRGFHQPAKELLEAVGAIERPQPKTAANVLQVQVEFNLPGLPQPRPPVIDVKE